VSTLRQRPAVPGAETGDVAPSDVGAALPLLRGAGSFDAPRVAGSEASRGATARVGRRRVTGWLDRARRWPAQAWPPAALLALFLLAWEAGVHVLDLPFYILPSPGRIARLLVADQSLLLAQAAVTLEEVLLGFAIAFVIGIVLALLIFSSRTIERAVYPLIIATQTVPVFAIAPLLVVWFGYGLPSKIAMAALIVFFPIVVNTVDGLRAADPDMVNLLLILGARPAQVLLKIRVPAALPFVFSGTRIAVATSVIGAVIGEWVGATQGLGFLMIHANAQLHVDLVFAAIVYLSVMALLLFGAVSLLEWTALPWRRAGSAE
jgi:putative hydroxymethylpyrimidine transport system permease protein